MLDLSGGMSYSHDRSPPTRGVAAYNMPTTRYLLEGASTEEPKQKLGAYVC